MPGSTPSGAPLSAPLTIADLRVVVADIPVRRPHHMSFTTLEAVNFVFVRLETREGHVGWGEAACLGGPTWSEESVESVAATIERYLAPWLIGRDASRIEGLRGEMARRVQGNPFARAAVEMALWDVNGRALGVPVARLLGGRVRDAVPLSWSLAVTDPEGEVAEARDLVARGHRIFKIKTAAHPVARDVERIRRIRDAVGPDVALRVDANQGWDRATALRAIRQMEPFSLDFVEQPVPRWDLEGLAHVAKSVTVPVMADESCFSPQDALAIARLGGVSILGLKVTKSAGILGTLAVARVAEAAGLGAYVGCMIETSLGTAAYLAVAVTAPPVTWGCELFGPLLLAGDVVRQPVRYGDGSILALDGPGLGVEVDETALEHWTRRV
ncbi:MAG TPA: muconate/chloromuconate family cycloisomerase [Candidatus Methylomirabilis sp.]|nr:muconate/chloromuconate family cycloisomerase [Candidatus Methylomirabilis sp.]